MDSAPLDVELSKGPGLILLSPLPRALQLNVRNKVFSFVLKLRSIVI